jgi:ADP-ribose pyrophosphatase
MDTNQENGRRIIPHEVWDLYQGKVIRLSKERVTLPNGVTSELEVIRHPGAAAVVPLLGDKRVVMINHRGNPQSR